MSEKQELPRPTRAQLEQLEEAARRAPAIIRAVRVLARLVFGKRRAE